MKHGAKKIIYVCFFKMVQFLSELWAFFNLCWIIYAKLANHFYYNKNQHTNTDYIITIVFSYKVDSL